MEERFQIGVITAPHGVNGEVKVYSTTDDPRRFNRLSEVILGERTETDGGALPGKVSGKDPERVLKVESVKQMKQFVVIKFAEIATVEEAEKLRQRSLYVPRKDAVRLKKDEYFIADLIGMKVSDEQGQEVGVLTDVLATGANDVYVIAMTDGRELLLPAIRQCILRVDVEEGTMQVHILDGLL